MEEGYGSRGFIERVVATMMLTVTNPHASGRVYNVGNEIDPDDDLVDSSHWRLCGMSRLHRLSAASSAS